MKKERKKELSLKTFLVTYAIGHKIHEPGIFTMGALDFPIVRLSVSPGAVSNRCCRYHRSPRYHSSLFPTPFPLRLLALPLRHRRHYIMDISMQRRGEKRGRERERTRGDRPRLAALAHVYEACVLLHLWIMLQPFCIGMRCNVTPSVRSPLATHSSTRCDITTIAHNYSTQNSRRGRRRFSKFRSFQRSYSFLY